MNQRFFIHPVNHHLLSTQHTLKKVCHHLLFGVPLDLRLGLLSLQYETDAFAYLICFMIESIKSFLVYNKEPS
jgi:hypothetical protein